MVIEDGAVLALDMTSLRDLRDLTVDHPDAPLMVAGVLAYPGAAVGQGRVERIEAWQLRDGRRRGWNRSQLLEEAIRLHDRLDEVEAALEP